MLDAEVAVRDVSEPEKNPENITRKTITTTAVISSVSISVQIIL
tara:strand:- start:38484 stop:38615 length:132 start_codon:yes stop_codon:yes gene_type:complete